MWCKLTKPQKSRLAIYGIIIAALLGIGGAALAMLNDPVPGPGAAPLTDGSYFIRPGHAASFDELSIKILVVQADSDAATLRITGQGVSNEHTARAGDTIPICGYRLTILETDPQKGIRFTLSKEL